MSDESMSRDYSLILDLIDMSPKRAAELAAGSDAARERHEKHRTDFLAFCRYYFPHYISSESAPWHWALSDIFSRVHTDEKTGKPYWKVTQAQALTLSSMHRPEFASLSAPVDRLRALALCAPREQAKSTLFARLLSIWMIIYGYARFVVIIRSSSDIADSFNRDSAIEFEDNTRLIADYGNLKGRIWKDGEYLFKNGAALVALGRGQSVRGLINREKRPDLIIMDDIITDEEAESVNMMRKVYKWIFSAVVNLSKNSLILSLNTIYNAADPQSKILERIRKRDLPGWFGVRLSAEIVDGQNALWPDYWPISALQEKKQEIGTLLYMIQYQSIAGGDSSSLVREDWIQFRPHTHFNLSEYDLTLGVDPNAEGADDVAIALMGKHKIQGTYMLVDAWVKDWGTITDMTDRLVSWHKLYDLVAIGFENVAFQKVYQKLLQEILLSQGINLPLVGVEAKGSKSERARSIGVWSENGTLTYSDKLEGSAVIYRLTNFPQKGIPDGIVDAIYHAYQTLNRGSGKPIGASGRKRPSGLPGILGRYRNG